MSDNGNLLLANARLVLVDRVIERGWLAVDKGMITELGEGEPPERGQDLDGDTLIPGLIELHTDHLEAHFTPRPGVHWHTPSAVMAYDAQIASAGITTVFDSIRLGSVSEDEPLSEQSLHLAEALEQARREGYLRVEHRTHLRCELATHDVVTDFEHFLANHPVHLVSLMDHTPGQRQFRDIGQWLRFHKSLRELGEAQTQAYIQERLDKHARHAGANRAELVRLARARAIAIASHDDATLSHVHEAIADGIAIAEFPTTREAAHVSHEAGIRVMMGAPNLVRGGSHTGNIAAAALAEEGVLDILSSDYVPASLLLAAFQLPGRVPGVALAAAIAMVSDTPAGAAGLADRGRLEAGRRADLVRIRLVSGTPIVRRVWQRGRIVA